MGRNRKDAINLQKQVVIQPKSGLESNHSYEVVKILNNTLADEVVLSNKTRCAYWNVHGASFFDRQSLFGIHYKQLRGISDEVSKRTCELGGLPMGSFTEFLKNTRLAEQPGVIPNIMVLLTDHEAIIRFMREDAKKCSEEYKDSSTFEFLVDVMRQHEKMAWMLRSHIEPELTGDERKGSTNSRANL